MSENIYKYNNEEIKYKIKSYVNMSDRIKIIKNTTRLCLIDDDYFSCLRKSKYINDNDVDTVIGIRK